MEQGLIMKIIVEGKLLSIVIKPDYKDKETGEVKPQKPLLQLMSERMLENGSVKMELHDITVPEEKIATYRDKVGKEVQVPCGFFAKNSQVTFYGI